MNQHHERHEDSLIEEHHEEVLLDQWGTVSVIVVGLLFLTLLVSFHPSW